MKRQNHRQIDRRAPWTILVFLLAGMLMLAACEPVVEPFEPDPEVPLEPGVASQVAEGTLVRASQIIDTPIANPDENTRGLIHDLVIELASGHILYPILSFDEPVEINDQLYPVPYAMTQLDPEGSTFLIDVDDLDLLENAPTLEQVYTELGTTADDVAAPGWDANVQIYWQNAGAFEPQEYLQQEPDPDVDPYYLYGSGTRILPGSAARFLVLTQREVLNQEGEAIGMIEDMFFDPTTGRMPFVAFSVTEAESDEQLSIVPIGAFTYNPFDDTFLFDLTADTLQEAPRFRADNWPDMSDPAWQEELVAYWDDVSLGVALRTGMRVLTSAAMEAADLFGYSVTNRLGENLGEIEDFVIGTESGELAYAVLEFEGFLDLGEDVQYLVPLNALTLDAFNQLAVLGISGELLEEAPSFDAEILTGGAEPGWDEQFRSYWSAWLAPSADVQSDDPAATSSAILASTLLNYNVQNPGGEALGEVEDLMLNLAQADLAYVVLEFGGFLDIGDEHFPIPPAAITLDPVQEILLVDVQPEMLEEMPGFDLDDRPDVTAPNWDAEYREYWDAQLGATPAE